MLVNHAFNQSIWKPGRYLPPVIIEKFRIRAVSFLQHYFAGTDIMSRARAAGVSWSLAEDLDDAQLEALLFPPPPAIAADQRPMPDWAWVHRELRRPNVARSNEMPGFHT